MLAVLTSAAALTLVGCSFKPGSSVYNDKLKSAGFDTIVVDRDEEKSGKKKKLVAYDFDWVVNTDGDDKTCTVELEHPANSSGSLAGDDWHIDEVNGEDVSGWGTDSPDAATVRKLLTEHHYDC
jgi:hypothetical protein